jgi:hypothetical protein
MTSWVAMRNRNGHVIGLINEAAHVDENFPYMAMGVDLNGEHVSDMFKCLDDAQRFILENCGDL